MSKLMQVPKPQVENLASIADFAEVECLRQDDYNVSVTDISRIIQREHDSSTDETILQRVMEAFGELEERSKNCGEIDGRYPFFLENQGNLLQFQEKSATTDYDPFIYLYLLLATRMNMKTEKKQGNEDGTVLFEQLCKEVAVRFFGGPSSEIHAILFGTGKLAEDRDDDDEIDRNQFVNSVNDLCEQLREGLTFSAHPSSARITAKDGKLDIVVWRRFADNRGGQLIGFGQCKTGTTWKNDRWKLQAGDFCSKWMFKSPAVNPFRMYFIADRVASDISDRMISQWHDLCVDAGILFDRCRIVEYSAKISGDLRKRIKNWVLAAAATKGLRIK